MNHTSVKGDNVSRKIHGNPYLSRPVGTNKPPRMRERVAVKGASIASDPRHSDQAWHYAAAAGIFVKVADLYDNRKKR